MTTSPRPEAPQLPSRALLRVLIPVVPTFGFVWLVSSTLWGPEGVLALHAERQKAAMYGAELAAAQRQTTMLQWELHRLKTDPLALERQVAAERGVARPGTTIHVIAPAPVSAGLASPGPAPVPGAGVAPPSSPKAPAAPVPPVKPVAPVAPVPPRQPATAPTSVPVTPPPR